MFNGIKYEKNASLKDFSTIKIGGRAKYIVFPKDEAEIEMVLQEAKRSDEKVLILGNGSNTLFDVEFFGGVVISTREIKEIEKIGKEKVFVGAGANLFSLNLTLSQMGLGGLEWSYGIPASFGGLVYMNGGAFGSEIKDFLETVRVLRNGKIEDLKASEIEFAYRTSNLKNCIILGGVLALKEEKTEKIKEKMQNYLQKRRLTQPYDFPSLGSTFKHIKENGGEIIYPAKLIDSLGLKGVKIGGVEVSTKHAGFLINSGNGTAEDYLSLAKLIEQKVYERFGLKLEKEVVLLSEVEEK